METYSIFMDWKILYCQNGIFIKNESKDSIQFQSKYQQDFFVDKQNWQSNSKIYIKYKWTKIAKVILIEVENSLPDFKTNYKATLIKTVFYQWKNR